MNCMGLLIGERLWTELKVKKKREKLKIRGWGEGGRNILGGIGPVRTGSLSRKVEKNF